MLGASQFVNVVLFQFSGPDVYLSAKPAPRSLSRDSTTANFSSSHPRRSQIDFISARGKTRALLRLYVDGPLTKNSREDRPHCGTAVI
jgi:hypothetical protein